MTHIDSIKVFPGMIKALYNSKRAQVMKNLMRFFLKRMTKEQRQVRLIFVGKRLAAKQAMWLHLSSHPWER